MKPFFPLLVLGLATSLLVARTRANRVYNVTLHVYAGFPFSGGTDDTVHIRIYGDSAEWTEWIPIDGLIIINPTHEFLLPTVDVGNGQKVAILTQNKGGLQLDKFWLDRQSLFLDTPVEIDYNDGPSGGGCAIMEVDFINQWVLEYFDATQCRYTGIPTTEPTFRPSASPTLPTSSPSTAPTQPTIEPTRSPVPPPTLPSNNPTDYPTPYPSEATPAPSSQPTFSTLEPTLVPTTNTSAPSPAPTIAPTTSAEAPLSASMGEGGGYQVALFLGGVFVIPIVIYVCAKYAHKKESIFVKPNFPSIFRVVAEFTDFYTDILFAVALATIGDELAMYAIAFVVIPWLLSAAVLFYITVVGSRNNNRISEYLTRFDWLFILLSLLGSVYPAALLCSSKLFLYSGFSLQLQRSEMRTLRVLRFFTTTILENIPQCTIQVLYAASLGMEKLDSITLTALLFTIMSLCISLFTQITRLISSVNGADYSVKAPLATYDVSIDINCDKLRYAHTFAHYLMSVALGSVLRIESRTIEVYWIRKIGHWTSLRIHFLIFDSDTHIRGGLKTHLSTLQSQSQITSVSSQSDVDMAPDLQLAMGGANRGTVTISTLSEVDLLQYLGNLRDSIADSMKRMLKLDGTVDIGEITVANPGAPKGIVSSNQMQMQSYP